MYTNFFFTNPSILLQDLIKFCEINTIESNGNIKTNGIPALKVTYSSVCKFVLKKSLLGEQRIVQCRHTQNRIFFVRVKKDL